MIPSQVWVPKLTDLVARTSGFPTVIQKEQVITPPTPAKVSWADEVEAAALEESAKLSGQMSE